MQSELAGYFLRATVVAMVDRANLEYGKTISTILELVTGSRHERKQLEINLSHSLVAPLFAGNGSLSPATNDTITAKLNELIRIRLKKQRHEDHQKDFLKALAAIPVVIVAEKERFAWVDPAALGGLWKGAKGKRAAAVGAPAAHSITLVIQLPQSVDYYDKYDYKIIRIFLEIAKNTAESPTIKKIMDGCTELHLQLSQDDAQRILEAFHAGHLKDLGIDRIYQLDAPALPPKPPVNMPSDRRPTSANSVEASVRAALRDERRARPWRRLAALVSRNIGFSVASPVIAESESRSFARPGFRERWPAGRSDFVAMFFYWPTATAATIALLSLLAAGVGLPIALGSGIMTGVLMAVIGSLPCATVISPLACGAGGIFLGVSFGFASAILLGNPEHVALLTPASIRADPFTTITGGIVGLTAPEWALFFSPQTMFLICLLTGAGIAAAAWLMAQPLRAKGITVSKFGLRDVMGAVGGSCGGIGIGAVFGITQLFATMNQSRWLGFIVGFAVVGGGFCFGCVWWRMRNVKRALLFSAAHILVSGILCAAVFALADTPFALLLVAVACAWYQSTWFTASFVLGEALSSERGAYGAVLLEGVGGFLGFVLARIFQG